MSNPFWLIPAIFLLSAAYALFVRTLTKPGRFAAHLKVGMVEILRDSIISNFIAFPIVWYSINKVLIKDHDGSYTSKFDNLINKMIAWLCNKTMIIESDYTTVPEIYAAYIVVFLLPSLISSYVHFVSKSLPDTDGYRETTHSPLMIFHGNKVVSRVMYFARSILNVFLIKTPIAFGALLMSVGILILRGKMGNQSNAEHLTWIILPIFFFFFTFLSQCALIVTTCFNAVSVYSDSRNLHKLNNFLIRIRAISWFRLP